MDALPAWLLTPLSAATLLIIMNCLAFSAFGIDKWKAQTGRWRTSESTLLWLAFMGGSPGAYLGRRLFRHKTRKQPFVGNLHAISLAQVVGIGGWIGWKLSG